MTWDAAGALGEIIGALAVVISVIYLAVQIRGQTDQAKLTATREISNQLDAILDSIIENPEISGLYLSACQDFEGLSNDERIKATFLFQRFARVYEQQWIHIEKGHVDPAFFESIEKTFFEWLTFPGVQQWWGRNKGFFESNFETRVEGLVSEAKAKGYDSTFKNKNHASA